jgi:EmrB/QacA subfamily drug resistance transporter
MSTGLVAALPREQRKPSTARWLALAVLCSSILIVNLDVTVLNVALPTLVRDLHATSNQLQWVVDAYALVFGGLLLVAGSVADRVGRKPVFFFGVSAFIVGSAWAAFSGSVSVLIAARASMGLGAAFMMPSTLSIITDVFRDFEERRRAIGFWAGTSGVGFAVGPIIGGLLLAHFWWGSVFLLNIPVGVVALASAYFLVPNSKNRNALAPDYVGGTLSVCGLGLLLWSIIEIPADGWSSVRVLTAGAVGIATLVGFLLWERRTAHPMLNFAFFRERSFSVAVISVSSVMFALVGGLFLLTQFLQFNLSNTPLGAGVKMLPVAGALAVVAPSSSVLARLIGTKLTTSAGLVLVMSGMWLISTSKVTWTYADLLPGLMLIGVGAALVLPTVSSSVISSVPRGDAGVGSATNGASIQVGGALGVAVMGSAMATRYQHELSRSIGGYAMPAAIHHTILGSIGGALSIATRLGGELGTRLAEAARSAFISGADLSLLIAAVIALAGGAIAIALFPMRIRDRSR